MRVKKTFFETADFRLLIFRETNAEQTRVLEFGQIGRFGVHCLVPVALPILGPWL